MATDGKIMHRARELLAERRTRRENRLRARHEEIYEKIPRIREIDQALRSTIADTIQVALSADRDPEGALDEIGLKNQALQAERRELLERNGYPRDYLDEIVMCQRCGDRGYTNAGTCSCLMDLYRQLQTEDLSNLLHMSDENFDAFSLNYYDDRTIHPVFGVTARQNMEYNYQLCLRYAETFGPGSPNLFLAGDTGLGKTFLSSCIAKAVSESGHSVVYDSASIVFDRFASEHYRFGETPEGQSEIARYLNCDLLILDDLGTEHTTNFVVSTLYTLVNTRLIREKKMIISSNYSLEVLGRQYSPQIMSRLEGEFERLTFFGADIRQLKKRQRLGTDQ